jgi:hypothetical protein
MAPQRAGQGPPLQNSMKRWLIAGFDVEGREARMVQAIAAHEIDHQKHQKRAENHNGDGYLKAELQVAGV